jgi:hypothetical protein
MILAVASLLLALVTPAQTDVKGRWEGSVTGERPDGTKSEDTALVILDQKDGKITGSLGGDDADQHPISSATIEGNKLTLKATHTGNGREFLVELTVDQDEMKGTVTSGERRGTLLLKRAKAK